MLPIIRLSQAWLDARGWSLAEGASLLELDQTSAVPAAAGDACPRCARPNTEYQGWVYVPDPATANPEHEHGRAYVLCVCGAMYWYSAVDVLNEPTNEARVRAAAMMPTTTTIEPGTGSLNLQGQLPEPFITESIGVTEAVAVSITPEPGTAEEPAAVPPQPEPLPPGVFVGTPPVRYNAGWYARNAWLFFGANPDDALGPVYYRRPRPSVPHEG